jgi:hypothetical protein
MRKLHDLKGTLAEIELLSMAATTHIKGGTSDAAEDEKRRQRPGGGINTNRPSGRG